MDPRDRDIVARTIVGEAANQPFEGQQAVANVIINRLRAGRYGSTIADVVFAPYQFEPWQTRRAELEAIQPTSPAYQNAMRAIDAAATGDVTGGATHFLQPDIVMQRRGGTLPGWAQGPSTRIGDHLFFTPGGRQTGNPQQASAAAPAPRVMATPAVLGPEPTPVSSALTALVPMTIPALTTGDTQGQPIVPPEEQGAVPDSTAVFEPRTFRRLRAARGVPAGSRRT